MDLPVQYLEMRYFATYYVANVAANVMRRPGLYIRHLEDCFGDLRTLGFIEPYRKWTNVHEYIDHALLLLLMEDEDEVNAENRSELWLSAFLKHYGIDHPTYEAWEAAGNVADLGEYACFLHENYFNAVRDSVIEEVFFLLFLNRSFLKDFNDFLAGYVRDLDKNSSTRMVRDGVVKRVTPPTWAKRAVFYRERGKCAFCRGDLSGLLSTFPTRNFDHIVPLAEGGTNDVANLQLLCADCNGSKGAKPSSTSLIYERWF